MDLALADKRALVTGGSRGIGRAVARAACPRGCRRRDRVARGREALGGDGGGHCARERPPRAWPIMADTGDDASGASAMVARGGGRRGRGHRHPGELRRRRPAGRGRGASPRGGSRLRAASQRRHEREGDGLPALRDEVAPHMQRAGVGADHQRLRARGTADGLDDWQHAQRRGGCHDEEPRRRTGAARHNVTVVHPGVTRTEGDAGRDRTARAAGQGVTPEGEVERRMGGGERNPPPRRRARDRLRSSRSWRRRSRSRSPAMQSRPAAGRHGRSTTDC